MIGESRVGTTAELAPTLTALVGVRSPAGCSGRAHGRRRLIFRAFWRRRTLLGLSTSIRHALVTRSFARPLMPRRRGERLGEGSEGEALAGEDLAGEALAGTAWRGRPAGDGLRGDACCDFWPGTAARPHRRAKVRE